MSKKKRIADPYAEREAEKYENPIPSRECIIEFLKKSGKLLGRKQIATGLGLTEQDDIRALKRRLRAMERDGQLVITRRLKYGVADKMDMLNGRVIAHKDGYGYVITEKSGQELFISQRDMRQVFHGDKVLIQPLHELWRGRHQAKIIEVLERNTQQVVGRILDNDGVYFLSPENKQISIDVLIPPEGLAGAQAGQIVVADIISQPNEYKSPVGKVREILGDHMDPGMEIDIAIFANNIPFIWPDEVEYEIAGLTEEVAEEDKLDRLDLRELPLVTIDGDDAKDFDDAVYCEKQKSGWTLYVAIADVAHYVKPGSALDIEAVKRGNSVYFPGRVIPMLPKVLSNGLCSLNPKVDRLCMVCKISLTKQGVIKDYSFHNAVMRSHARLTYTKVSKILAGKNPALLKQNEALIPHLQNLYDLFQQLHKQRAKRGAIEFDITETKIVFGKNKKIDQIIPLERTDAHRLIEECMLAANVCAADFLLENKIQGLFRVHGTPSKEKLNDLREFLGEQGLTLSGRDDPKPKDFAKLLDQVQDRPDKNLIQIVLLRSLTQAVYHPDNDGHFGLAYDAYAHYTSPIRRYPDLLMHRALKHIISGKSASSFSHSHQEMLHFGDQCSMTERRADEATRDAVEWLKCEYMEDKVGEEFTGRISAVTGFGLFVLLDDIFVEGLIHISELKNDYYHFDQISHCLRGEVSGMTYKLDQPLKILVSRVSLDDRKIDFVLA